MSASSGDSGIPVMALASPAASPAGAAAAAAAAAAADLGAWQSAVASEWAARRAADAPSAALFPLAANPFGEEEILAMTDVLLSGRLTLGENVERAEKEFAREVGAPFAVMVNSGSSANLLMLSAVINPQRAVHINPGDEVFVPAVCWSTSVAPLLQLGLKPVFVDVEPSTFNIAMDSLERAFKAHPAAKAIMAVHVLGNSTDMRALMSFVQKNNLILVEDTCESLGSTAVVAGSAKGARGASAGADSIADADSDVQPWLLGTFGEFGAFSFYFSHHITSGEGGMVVCQTEDDFNFLRCLRAHGWTRHLTNKAAVEAEHAEIDPRFLFVNVGYNLRPMEVQGAMLRVQLRKLRQFNACRRDNLARIEAALKKEPRFSSLMTLMQAAPGTDPAWFGIGVLLHRPFAHQLRAYLDFLDSRGIENRPVISGNFVRQPLIRAYLPDIAPEDYPGAEALHTRGFFIGVHQLPVSESDILALVQAMMDFPFEPRRIVLVTGSDGMLGRHVMEDVSKVAVPESSTLHLDRKSGSPALRRVLTRGTGVGPDGKSTAGVQHDPSAGGILSPREYMTEWVFATRADGDLNDAAAVEHLFKRVQPTHVLHLAARLQSLNEMTTRPVDFWMSNVTANNNVLSTAHAFQSWCGPIKVVSVLSTVMFPRDAEYPVDASQAVVGTLHPAGESYALAKRALASLSRWYREQHGANFNTVLPGNFFGAHGDFGAETAPLVNALIAKAVAACDGTSGERQLKVMGTGKPLRQLMHASDLARILLWALENLNQPTPLLVAGPEHSIQEIAELVCASVGFGGALSFDSDAVDGPLKRTADNSEFVELCPEFTFAPLDVSLARTVAWYREQRA